MKIWICGQKNDADIPWQETFAKFAKHMPAFSQNNTAVEGKGPRRHCADFTLRIDTNIHAKYLPDDILRQSADFAVYL
jgi:hypothetical protein